MDKTFNFSELRQFTGTEHYYRHQFVRQVTYTDGVQYLAERVGAYWLIDDIIFAQCGLPAVKAEEFQLWRLVVRDNRGTLACENGNGRVIIEKQLDYTDFPAPGIILYFCHGVLLLPSEY